MRRRLLLSVALVLATLPGCSSGSLELRVGQDPTCLPERLVLLAQAVPTAELIPCVGAYNAGWRFDSIEVVRGRALFALDSDRGGDEAVTVVLERSCDVEGVTEIGADPDAQDARRFQRVTEVIDRFVGERYHVFEGGCVTYRFRIDATGTGVAGGLAAEVSEQIDFMPRSRIAQQVADYGDDRFRLDP